jgi:hypothetical protein
VRGFQSAAFGAPERMSQMNPAARSLRSELGRVPRNARARLPLGFFGVYLPADFENVGMDAEMRCDVFEFLVRLDVIAESEPCQRTDLSAEQLKSSFVV